MNAFGGTGMSQVLHSKRSSSSECNSKDLFRHGKAKPRRCCWDSYHRNVSIQFEIEAKFFVDKPDVVV